MRFPRNEQHEWHRQTLTRKSVYVYVYDHNVILNTDTMLKPSRW